MTHIKPWSSSAEMVAEIGWLEKEFDRLKSEQLEAAKMLERQAETIRKLVECVRFYANTDKWGSCDILYPWQAANIIDRYDCDQALLTSQKNVRSFGGKRARELLKELGL